MNLFGNVIYAKMLNEPKPDVTNLLMDSKKINTINSDCSFYLLLGIIVVITLLCFYIVNINNRLTKIETNLLKDINSKENQKEDIKDTIEKEEPLENKDLDKNEKD